MICLKKENPNTEEDVFGERMAIHIGVLFLSNVVLRIKERKN